MEINYIILAHKNPSQLLRLVNTLNSTNCNFYIHIDKGTDINPFLEALVNIQNAFFLSDSQREHGTWGDIGIVKATIAMLSEIVKHKRNGYCVLMSGQDYPLRSNKFISDFFKENYGVNYIVTYPLPHMGWGPYGGLDRLNHYKTNLSKARLDFVQLPSIFEKVFYQKQTTAKLLKLLKKRKFGAILKVFIKRNFPSYLKPYGGSQWWALPIETVLDILAFTAAHPTYLSYHSDTLLPDEIFFHSILMHIKRDDRVVMIKRGITYVNWERENTLLPVTFAKEDIEELKAASQHNLFARKFDTATDTDILSFIDEELLKTP